MKRQTGLKDDYGTPIKEGDTIEWTFQRHGIMAKGRFIGGVATEMVLKEFKETKKIEYEVREDSAGYFLDRPSGGISMTYIRTKTKCKIIQKKIKSK